MPLNNFTAANGSFIELQSTESTNNYAMGLIKQGLAQHGSACFAHKQTKGKGQRGKQWFSATGENIILSIIIDISPVLLSRQFYFSSAIALGCYNFYKKYAIDDVTVKWPNDIYWRDRKAAGILIENIIKGESWQWAVAGVGMNINQTAFEVEGKKPVSLKQITGKEYDVIALAKELQVFLLKSFEMLLSNPEEILKNYNEVLFNKNKIQHFKKGSIVFKGKIEGVTSTGELIITTGGITEHFTMGEIEWIF